MLSSSPYRPATSPPAAWLFGPTFSVLATVSGFSSCLALATVFGLATRRVSVGATEIARLPEISLSQTCRLNGGAVGVGADEPSPHAASAIAQVARKIAGPRVKCAVSLLLRRTASVYGEL